MVREQLLVRLPEIKADATMSEPTISPGTVAWPSQVVRSTSSVSSWRTRVRPSSQTVAALEGAEPSQNLKTYNKRTNRHLLPTSLQLPCVCAVHASGTWKPHPQGGVRQATGDAFQGLAADADEYLHMRLPEAVLIDAAHGGLLHSHITAWRLLLAAEDEWGLVVERGTLLASTMRDTIRELIADVRALDASWHAIHMLAVVNPTLVGAQAGSMLRAAPDEGDMAPCYLLSRRGAQAALDYAAHLSLPLAAGDEGWRLYAALKHRPQACSSALIRGPCYACSKAIVHAPARASPSSTANSTSPPMTQQESVARLHAAGGFACPGDPDTRLAVACMVAIDRLHFANPGTSPADAYAERALVTKRTVMSSPSAHARAAAVLLPAIARERPAHPGNGRPPPIRVLDVGAGSGYTSAVFALLVGSCCDPDGDASLVAVLEVTEALAKAAVDDAAGAIAKAASLSDASKARASSLLVAVAGDGHHGASALAPFDAIYVGGSCAEVPEALLDQLASGGRLLLAVGESDAPQQLTLIERRLDDGVLVSTVLDGATMMYGLKDCR